ncbi:MerR family transcriptional regulator [Streptomyces sp. VRA16 Mangrove soil]|uniref:DNA polymerase III subunit beta family protein n=1 Tax=Streptomyces sp. VRA16 Mangrove soil TaxID=2817434 RepID=UPI001A9E45AF|nr:MerR family transcriptional regulator [Streptomyces sp. VRA16 Mangrove soil]MBO1333612.1 MerR family transcriptional regulator [Streptomyces sp. VRA16 Mangrove soil]
MRSIGELARDSGLGVSALRFYDRAGVLVPDRVDPLTGYRWYAPEQLDEARLLARLRRAGMPLADIRLVLASWSGKDTVLVRNLLDAHLDRLEQGLFDARTAFSALRAALDERENTMTAPAAPATTVRLTVTAGDLSAALDAVRFAASTDPGLPMLAGVLFDVEDGTLRLVATDRYRMAVARAAVDGYDGERVQVVVPSALADAMRPLLDAEERVTLTVDGGRVSLDTGTGQTSGPHLDHDFPDYRRLLPPAGARRATVDTAAFRRSLETGPVRTDDTGAVLSVLGLAADGTVTLAQDPDGDPDRVAVNRGYLLEALTAGARAELVLELDAPTTPVAVRRPDDGDTFSLLMPVRLEA